MSWATAMYPCITGGRAFLLLVALLPYAARAQLCIVEGPPALVSNSTDTCIIGSIATFSPMFRQDLITAPLAWVLGDGCGGKAYEPDTDDDSEVSQRVLNEYENSVDEEANCLDIIGTYDSPDGLWTASQYKCDVSIKSDTLAYDGVVSGRQVRVSGHAGTFTGMVWDSGDINWNTFLFAKVVQFYAVIPCQNFEAEDNLAHAEVENDTEGPVQAFDRNATADVLCCHNQETSCIHVALDEQGCPQARNHTDAMALCSARGLRLCLREELLSGLCCESLSSCGNSTRFVWSSTTIDGPTTTETTTTTLSTTTTTVVSGTNSQLPTPKLVGDAVGSMHVVRRGNCSFSRKASIARSRGAVAAIVVDFVGSQTTTSEIRRTLVSGNGQFDGDKIIPMIVVSGADGDPLAAALAKGEHVVAEIRLDLPRNPSVLDLWIPFGELTATELLSEIVPMALTIGPRLAVRPRFRVVALPPETPAVELDRRCLGSLRQFCAAASGVFEGEEALAEASRQHCIRLLATADPQAEIARNYGDSASDSPDLFRNETFLADVSATASSAAWLAYMEKCLVLCQRRLSGRGFSAPSLRKCSHEAIAAIGMKVGSVEACADVRGIVFLEDDREARAWGKPSEVAVRIDGWRYSGPLVASTIMKTICRTMVEPVPVGCARFFPTEEKPEPLEIPLWILVCLCVGAAVGVRSLSSCSRLFLRWRRKRSALKFA